MHDLLIGCLAYAGKADVYISSYAFSEYSANLIADLRNRRIIKNLWCIIHNTNDKRNSNALNIIRDCSTVCKMWGVHAKVTLIEGAKNNIAIIGSANYTSSKCYETGIIAEDREVVEFHKRWIMEEINSL